MQMVQRGSQALDTCLISGLARGHAVDQQVCEIVAEFKRQRILIGPLHELDASVLSTVTARPITRPEW